MKTLVREYASDGQYKDEGGRYNLKKVDIPPWVNLAMGWCGGCHDDVYNHQQNFTGDSWCFSLQAAYARRKTRPPCYHQGEPT